MTYWIAPIVALALLAIALGRVVRNKKLDVIIRGNAFRRREEYEGARHIFFCIVDHFEPYRGDASQAVARERVSEWLARYPEIVDPYRDNGDRRPQHDLFYPQEEYDPRCLEMLETLQAKGCGNVEIHLHHDGDTSEQFREKVVTFKTVLHEQHGLLQRDPSSGEVTYGFIHGNWALDDSGRNGRWCGVKDEITILKETGCYADFTYPSAPHPSQPPIVNQIYYATDDPLRAKSHHRGIEAAYKAGPQGDLLLVTGPLALNWRKRRRGVFPAIENGDVTLGNPPTPDRVDLWVRTGISVKGWPRWVFIKVHTHGLTERNAALFLGDRVKILYEYLLAEYNDGDRYVVHFVTARDMCGCIKSLESGDEKWIRKVENFDYSVDATHTTI